MILEDKLAETIKWLAKVGVENTNLGTALLAKEKSIDDLNKQKSKLEADLDTVSSQLYISKKDNGSLKYEVRVLEKEVQFRSEEREFNCRTADASHRNHLESSKKTAKLESECQRLHVLVRKRLPGLAALAKMKNEVELLGRESVNTRTRKLKSNPNDLLESVADSTRVNFLTEKLCASEEENKNLKDALSKKIQELRFSQTMYARAASKLSEIESQLEEMAKGPATSGDLALMSDFGSNDKVSCVESLCKTGRASDLSLMDDFIEMEKFAVVSVKDPSARSCVSVSSRSESESDGNSSREKRGEAVPVLDSNHLVETERDKSSKSSDKSPEAIQLKPERETSRSELKPEETQLRSDSEITAASEKLAECQETILNLGKQAKALASSAPKDAFGATNFASPKKKLTQERSTLLDLIAEDNVTTTKDDKFVRFTRSMYRSQNN